MYQADLREYALVLGACFGLLGEGASLKPFSVKVKPPVRHGVGYVSDDTIGHKPAS
jgi:hypothetical protein